MERISIGYNYSLGVKTNGTLWGWGQNNTYQLGITFSQAVLNPTQITSETNWSNTSARYRHSMAIKSNGTLWGWGENFNSEVGLGDISTKTFPHQTGDGASWISIAVGLGFTLAVKSNGTLWTWGDNYYGQTGNGTSGSNDVIYPQQIGTDSKWTKVSAGNTFGVGLNSNGELFSWGKNDRGQLGNNTTTNNSTPVLINCPIILSTNSNENHKTEIQVYPNPAKDFIILKNKKKENFVYQIFDLSGRMIKTGKGNFNEKIDVKNLGKGNYVLQVQSVSGEKFNGNLIKD